MTPFALGDGPKYHALSSANDQWKLGNPTECADRDRGRVHHRKERKRRSNVPIYQFMSAKKQRAVIVDDHPLFRERLAQLINHELDMEVCGEAENAQDAIQLIRNTCPDLAIIDVTLKGSSGLELIKSMKALSIGIPILVLSMHDEALYAERALRAGATGYITKHQVADQIIQAVRRVLAGEVYLSERMTASFLKSLTSAGVKSIPRPVDRLTWLGSL